MTPGSGKLMALTLMVVVGCGTLFFFKVPLYRLSCGHKETIYEHYFPKPDGMRHFCSGVGLLIDLRSLQSAHQDYLLTHDREFTSLQELTKEPNSRYEYPFRDPECYHLEWSGRGKDWQCHVERTSWVAGYFLMTESGTIYFNERRPATTKDEVLIQGR